MSATTLGRTNATVWDPVQSSMQHTAASNKADLHAVFPSHLLLGVETDVTFPGMIESNGYIIQIPTRTGYVYEHMDYHGSLRGRLGYTADPCAQMPSTLLRRGERRDPRRSIGYSVLAVMKM